MAAAWSMQSHADTFLWQQIAVAQIEHWFPRVRLKVVRPEHLSLTASSDKRTYPLHKIDSEVYDRPKSTCLH